MHSPQLILSTPAMSLSQNPLHSMVISVLLTLKHQTKPTWFNNQCLCRRLLLTKVQPITMQLQVKGSKWITNYLTNRGPLCSTRSTNMASTTTLLSKMHCTTLRTLQHNKLQLLLQCLNSNINTLSKTPLRCLLLQPLLCYGGILRR